MKKEAIALSLALLALTGNVHAVTNGALRINDTNQYAHVNDTPAIRMSSGDYTLSGWILREDGQQTIMSKRSSSTSSYRLYVIGNGTPVIKVNATTLRGATNILPGIWHHIVTTYRSTDGVLSLYANGELVGQTNNIPNPIDTLNSFYMGYDQFQGSGPCLLDSISLWNKHMEQYEIRGLSSTRLTGSESGLISYWNFDSTNIVDITASGNNAVIFGSAHVEFETTQTLALDNAVVVPTSGGFPYSKHRLEYTTNTLTGAWQDTGRFVYGGDSSGLIFDIIRPYDAIFYRVVAE